MTDAGWFEAADPAAAIRDGRGETPTDWPWLAVEAGVATDDDDYYRQLHDAAVEAAREEAAEREGAADRQLAHAVRAMDDKALQLT